MLSVVHPSECDWAREAASTRADGELLSELEHARLTAHLRGCAACEVFGAETAALARALRDAPLEQPRVSACVPRRRRAPALRVQAAAAALVATALGGSFALGHLLGPSGGQTVTIHSTPDIESIRADVVEQHLLAMLPHAGNRGLRFGTSIAL